MGWLQTIAKGARDVGQGVANVATGGLGNNMFSKDSQKMVAPIVQLEQVGFALPFTMMTAGQSNKLLPKGTQESTPSKLAVGVAEVATVAGAVVAGGYAMTGGFAGLGAKDLIIKGPDAPAPIGSVESPKKNNDYTVPLITGAILLLGSKLL